MSDPLVDGCRHYLKVVMKLAWGFDYRRHASLGDDYEARTARLRSACSLLGAIPELIWVFDL